VLEVAVTQDAKSVKRKARHYITGSRGKIAFVVVIIVRRMKKQMVEQGGAQSNIDGTLKSQDDLRNEASDTTRTDSRNPYSLLLARVIQALDANREQLV
jgi:hypothetical protein